MSPHLEARLRDRHPALFRDLYGDPRETCMHRGLECDDGWFGIIERLCRRLEEVAPPGFKFTQVKEKFGSLRIYSTKGTEETQELIKGAMKESLGTCELCGSTRGVATRMVRWIKTVCDACERTSSGS